MVLFLGFTHRLLPLFHPRLPSPSPSLVRSAMSQPDFSTPRPVVKRVLAKQQHEGQGAVVRRSIGRNELRSLDPFLMLDEFSVSPPAGFPDHPHRGFETVTYMLQGAFTHQDFAGNRGTIRTGDVQWMTAGRGIIHSEMPAGEGVNKGLQLWINLSSRDKMYEHPSLFSNFSSLPMTTTKTCVYVCLYCP